MTKGHSFPFSEKYTNLKINNKKGKKERKKRKEKDKGKSKSNKKHSNCKSSKKTRAQSKTVTTTPTRGCGGAAARVEDGLMPAAMGRQRVRHTGEIRGLDEFHLLAICYHYTFPFSFFSFFSFPFPFELVAGGRRGRDHGFVGSWILSSDVG